MQAVLGGLRRQAVLLHPHPLGRPGLSPRSPNITRFFHPSRKLRSSLLDTSCIHINDALTGLHTSTGIPWLLVLPLAAVLVRSTFVLPFSIWARINLQRTASIRPLLLAWQPIIMRGVMKENSHLGPDACKRLAEATMKEKRTELFSAFQIRRWPALAPLLQLPIFLLVIETIRRMCGQNAGLLGWLASLSGAASGQGPSVPIETSMASEGGLWFPDLLVPDPSLILPATLSMIIFFNASEFGRTSARAGVAPSRAFIIGSRALKLVALAAFPLTLSIPSGILVYWISSALSASLMHLLLRVMMPLPASPTPCRPLIKPYMRDPTS